MKANNFTDENMYEGQVLNGTVKNIKPYGAFIKLENGVTGLAYIEDLSVARIKSPEERLKIGQNLQIMVKSIDKEKNRVMLTYKELLGTGEENAQKFKEGMFAKGIVREIEKNKNGIFVELTPNLVGMAEYTEEVEYGQEVDVYIKKIVPERKKIKLLIEK